MAKYDFGKILLMWRPSNGERRINIGTISINKQTKELSFLYNNDGVEQAKNLTHSFHGYPGLPLEQNKFSSEQLKEVFFCRLFDVNRNDAPEFLDFWLVDRNRLTDNIYLLAQTQGLSFSDMYEFIPQYYVSSRTSFITDIAGLSKSLFDISKLKKGDRLDFKKEIDNRFDKHAVIVTFKNEKIGYIKKGHNSIFEKKDLTKIKLEVWESLSLFDTHKLYVKVSIKP